MVKTLDKPKIFISYRRSDASANAGRLFDWLGHQFGRAQVFLDTDKIQAGAQFPKVLAQQLADCDVVLVVIGPDWLAAADEHGRRLDQSHDFVRQEIETALSNGKRVIPLLVQDAEMPGKDDLPLSIQDLASRNAISLGDASFERDFDALVDDLLQRPRGFMRRELDRLQRIILVASRSAVIIPLLVIILVLACFMKVFDSFSLDTRVSSYLLLAADPAPESDVLLVTIDAKSREKFGPLNSGNRENWRRNYAQLINRASAAQAKAVVFDLYLEKPTAADSQLAKAVSDANNKQTRTVFGIKNYNNGKPMILDSLIRAQAQWGSLCAVQRLGQLFMIPLLVHKPAEQSTSASIFDDYPIPGIIPSLSLSASRAETPDSIDLSRREILFADSSQTRPVKYSSFELINWVTDTCGTLTTGDEAAMLLVRIPTPEYWHNNSRQVSFADILAPNKIKDEQLRGRIILVGVTYDATEQSRDLHTIFRLFSRSAIPGVELQASAIADISTGRTIKTPTLGWQAFIITIMALLGAGISLFTATHSNRWRTVIYAIVLATYLSIAVLFAGTGLLLNILYDLAAFFITHNLLRWLQRRALRSTHPELES